MQQPANNYGNNNYGGYPHGRSFNKYNYATRELENKIWIDICNIFLITISGQHHIFGMNEHLDIPYPAINYVVLYIMI